MTIPEPTPAAAPEAVAPSSNSEENVTGVVASPEPEHAEATRVIARPATATEQQVLFVPLAVNIGDGFKFGCGFFLAAVVAMLIGFVLFAALFVLGSVFNVNLPLAR